MDGVVGVVLLGHKIYGVRQFHTTFDLRGGLIVVRVLDCERAEFVEGLLEFLDVHGVGLVVWVLQAEVMLLLLLQPVERLLLLLTVSERVVLFLRLLVLLAAREV